MSTVSGSSLQASLAHRTVLVIDDSEAVRTAFDVLLSLHGGRVLAVATPAEGLAALVREGVDLVIQDMNFRREATGGEEGIALFHEIRARFPEVPIATSPPGRIWRLQSSWCAQGAAHRQAVG
jgi:DNA-binding NtrC family response regulator